MNCNDVNKWSTDIVAIIRYFVKSKSGLFPGHSYLVTIVGITASCVKSLMVILATGFVLIVFRYYKTELLKTATWGEKYMRNNAYN